MNGTKYYRSGRVYFKARLIKSRNAYKVWWLYPGCDDYRSRGLWPPSAIESARKLKGRPGNRALRKSWEMR